MVVYSILKFIRLFFTRFVSLMQNPNFVMFQTRTEEDQNAQRILS